LVSAGTVVFGGVVILGDRFVMADDFADDEVQEFLGEGRI
jgi:hypothetical protein